MRKIAVLVAAMTLFLGICEVPYVRAECPNFKVVCKDNTCYGWYGTCWSWVQWGCVPCSNVDYNSICVNHKGWKCVKVSNPIYATVVCDLLQLPSDICFSCGLPTRCK